MRTTAKYFITAALGILTLAGCGKQEHEPDVPGRKEYPEFSATIVGQHSRAFDQQWEPGDEIGISGANRSNVCYRTVDGLGSFTVKTSGKQIYFSDDSETSFSAYYPWTDLAAGTTTVGADTRKQADQKSFDFLWAKAYGKKDAPNVEFKFDHVMAKIVLTVRPGEGMSYDEVKKTTLSLDGFRHTGSFNTAVGTVTAGNTVEAWAFTEFASLNDTDRTLVFSLIVFPQLHERPLDFLAELELADGKILSLRAAIDFTNANKEKDGDTAKNEWVAGRQYNLGVTLNKSEVKFDQCVINPWSTVAVDDITVE